MGASFFETVVAGFYRVINRWRVWYRLPFPLAVINLLALRIDLRSSKDERPGPSPFEGRCAATSG
jgi:hypothetical protein